MHRTTRRAALAALTLFGLAARLEGQVFGLPVRNAGVPTGLTLAADLGFPNSDGGSGWALGVSGALGLGPLGLTASAARRNPDDFESFNSFGATANLKIFGGPLIPLSITAQAGAARGTQELSAPATGEATLWHFPLGVGFTVTIPNPVVAIKPWAAPRLDITRIKPPGGSSDTDTNFGVSGGVDLSFLSGLGIRAMYDRVWAGNGFDPSIVSVGLSWGLTLGR